MLPKDALNRRFSPLPGIVVSFGIVAILSWIFRKFFFDDVLIYYRCVRNCLEGAGLVFNKGDYLNCLTSPSYTYLLAGCSSVVGDVPTAGLVISSLFLMLAVWVYTMVFTTKDNVLFISWSAICFASSTFFYTTYGMETTLYVFLIGLCLASFQKQDYYLQGISCALLLLTRPEGAFLILAMFCEHIRQRRPFPKPVHFIAPALLVVSCLVLNKLYCGQAIPGTLIAKLYQGASELWGPWPTAFFQVGYFFSWIFGSDRFLLFAALGMAILGSFRGLFNDVGRISLMFLGFCTVFYAVCNVPYYHWYYGPYFAIGAFFAGGGAFGVYRWARGLSNFFVRTVVIVTLFSVMAGVPLRWFAVSLRSPAADYDVMVPGEAIKWIKTNIPPGSRIGACEVGQLGWFTDLHVTDPEGVVTRDNAKFLGRRDFDTWLKRDDPEYVLVHDPHWAQEIGVMRAAQEGRYVEDDRFRFHGLKLFRKDGVRDPRD